MSRHARPACGVSPARIWISVLGDDSHCPTPHTNAMRFLSGSRKKALQHRADAAQVEETPGQAAPGRETACQACPLELEYICDATVLHTLRSRDGEG